MNVRVIVQRCWVELATRHDFSGPASQRVLDELLHAYAEPHRFYHTLDHIAALLRLLDEHGLDAKDRDALVLAMLFHDAVYDPARQDNESASADFASERLKTLGAPADIIATVRRLILATQHEAVNASSHVDPDLELLLDLDLSTLAGSPDDYRAYGQAIRREFALYPDEVYRPGRRRMLQGFLARDRIFRTPRLFALWEAPARSNIAGEIAELT